MLVLRPLRDPPAPIGTANLQQREEKERETNKDPRVTDADARAEELEGGHPTYDRQSDRRAASSGLLNKPADIPGSGYFFVVVPRAPSRLLYSASSEGEHIISGSSKLAGFSRKRSLSRAVQDCVYTLGSSIVIESSRVS